MLTKTFLSKALYATILALPLVIITSCGDSDDSKAPMQTEQKKKSGTQVVFSDSLQIEMELPASMESTTMLNRDLSFQYKDGAEELYIVGNKEDKEIARLTLAYMDKMDESISMAENYLNLSIDQMKESGNEVTVIDKPSKIEAKNASGMVMQVDGKIPNIPSPIAYWYACYEYKGNMYKFIFWTLKSKKNEVRTTAMKAFRSIRFK